MATSASAWAIRCSSSVSGAAAAPEEVQPADHLASAGAAAPRAPTCSRRRRPPRRSAASARRARRGRGPSQPRPAAMQSRQGPSSFCSWNSSSRRICSLEEATTCRPPRWSSSSRPAARRREQVDAVCTSRSMQVDDVVVVDERVGQLTKRLRQQRPPCRRPVGRRSMPSCVLLGEAEPAGARRRSATSSTVAALREGGGAQLHQGVLDRRRRAAPSPCRRRPCTRRRYAVARPSCATRSAASVAQVEQRSAVASAASSAARSWPRLERPGVLPGRGPWLRARWRRSAAGRRTAARTPAAAAARGSPATGPARPRAGRAGRRPAPGQRAVAASTQGPSPRTNCSSSIAAATASVAADRRPVPGVRDEGDAAAVDADRLEAALADLAHRSASRASAAPAEPSAPFTGRPSLPRAAGGEPPSGGALTSVLRAP